MNQDRMKQKILELHNKHGIPYTFIAKEIGISKPFLSMWLKDTRNFSYDSLVKTQKFLEKQKGILNYE